MLGLGGAGGDWPDRTHFGGHAAPTWCLRDARHDLCQGDLGMHFWCAAIDESVHVAPSLRHWGWQQDPASGQCLPVMGSVPRVGLRVSQCGRTAQLLPGLVGLKGLECSGSGNRVLCSWAAQCLLALLSCACASS
jgi:hypothetical protein